MEFFDTHLLFCTFSGCNSYKKIVYFSLLDQNWFGKKRRLDIIKKIIARWNNECIKEAHCKHTSAHTIKIVFFKVRSTKLLHHHDHYCRYCSIFYLHIFSTYTHSFPHILHINLCVRYFFLIMLIFFGVNGVIISVIFYWLWQGGGQK